MRKIYNKLVRDKIPQIISSNNGTPCVSVLNNERYLEELNTKLNEELKEYLESGDIEELCDLEEVLQAILQAKNVSYEDFEKLRNAKSKKRGAFNEKLFLEYVDE